MKTPEKYDWMVRFRKWADGFVLEGVYLPNINPDIVSVLSVFLMAVAFVRPLDYWWIVMFATASLILDWLDGVIARKFDRVSRRGYWVDMTCDRICELMIAIYSPLLWVPLFAVNMILTFVNMKTRVHLMLPLRAAFIIFFLFKIAGIDFGWI